MGQQCHRRFFVGAILVAIVLICQYDTRTSNNLMSSKLENIADDPSTVEIKIIVERKTKLEEQSPLLSEQNENYRTRRRAKTSSPSPVGITESSSWREDYKKVMNDYYGNSWNFYGWSKVQPFNGGSRSPIKNYTAIMFLFGILHSTNTSKGEIYVTLYDNSDLEFQLMVVDAGKDCAGHLTVKENGCIVEIHEGNSCKSLSQIGLPFYDSSNIEWTKGNPYINSKYESDFVGMSDSIVNVYNGGNGFGEKENENRAVVLRNAAGMIVLCGIMSSAEPTVAPTSPPTLSPTNATVTQAPTLMPTLSPTAMTTTLAPSSMLPSTLSPTTAVPSTMPPTTTSPTTVLPSTLPPTTLPPTTVLPSTIPPTTLPPTTVLPTTLPPTTVLPTTVSPTTVLPTTLPPTTVFPTTVLPTTIVPNATLPSSYPSRKPTVRAPASLAPQIPTSPSAPSQPGPTVATSPSTPIGPTLILSPASPTGPMFPISPTAPVGPPTLPSGPTFPTGLVAPISPAAPISPTSPSSPISPIAPIISPSSPTIPFGPSTPNFSPAIPALSPSQPR